jgi:RND family efflux transporter MFP subunit
MTRITLCCLLAAVLAAGCGKEPRSHKWGTVSERLTKAEVESPKVQTLIRKVGLAATVEALREVDICARVPGVVAQIPPGVDIGKAVKAGELLLKLGVPDLEADRDHKKALAAQARKSVALAKEALAVAKREVEEVEKEDKRYRAEVAFASKKLDRIKDLVRQRAQDISLQEEAERQYEAAQAAREANSARKLKREAGVKAAEAQLALDEQKVKVADAALGKAEALMSFATVTAPFDAVITSRRVHPGATIKDPGTVLLTVMDVGRVRVLIDVPQRDVPLLNDDEARPNRKSGKGDPVVVTIPALSEKVPPRGEFKGTVTRVARSLDPVTRTMRAEIELDNPDGLLQPGMYGSASVTLAHRKGVITVNSSAIVRKGEGEVGVFIVADVQGEGERRKGVLRWVPVQLGIDDGTLVQISSGLTGSELVVARGASVMRADDEVLAIDAP